MIDFYHQIKQTLTDLSGGVDFDLSIPSQAAWGDLSTNLALILASQENKSPHLVADELSKKLRNHQWLQANQIKVETAGQGFINFFLPLAELHRQVCQAAGDKNYGKQNFGEGQVVVVEYSSPNTNKPLHLGHLRNDAIGMSLAKIYEFFGFRVIKTEVINDRGIHIMKSLLAYQKWGSGLTPEKAKVKGDKLVGNFYVKYNEAVNDHPALADEASHLLSVWEKKDKAVLALWSKLNNWVYQGWQETYQTYGSEFDVVYYESELYDQGREIIQDAVTQGLAQKKIDGTVVIDLSTYGLGGRDSGEKVLLRPDGTTVYITQDIYLALKRWRDFHFDKMIYVVGDEQLYHFKVLFKILSLLGFSWVEKCLHFAYGQVLLPDGKMKSREGKVVDADDLINDLTTVACQEVAKRQTDLSQPEQLELAKSIAVAAIKYWFLKSSHRSNIIFDPQASLSLEGNTGPYLLYSLVRLQRILQKSGSFSLLNQIDLGESEAGLARKISQWPIVVNLTYEKMQINYLTEYLYELSGLANNYYQSVPVLKADQETKLMRLHLVQATANILATGLHLLNIKTVNKM